MAMFLNFFSEVLKEVRAISWMDRSAVFSLSFVIFVFSAVFSVFFFCADYAFLAFLRLFVSIF